MHMFIIHRPDACNYVLTMPNDVTFSKWESQTVQWLFNVLNDKCFRYDVANHVSFF